MRWPESKRRAAAKAARSRSALSGDRPDFGRSSESRTDPGQASSNRTPRRCIAHPAAGHGPRHLHEHARLTELIVLNVGLEFGVISPPLFTTLGIMAVATTFATTPVLDHLR